MFSKLEGVVGLAWAQLAKQSLAVNNAIRGHICLRRTYEQILLVLLVYKASLGKYTF